MCPRRYLGTWPHRTGITLIRLPTSTLIILLELRDSIRSIERAACSSVGQDRGNKDTSCLRLATNLGLLNKMNISTSLTPSTALLPPTTQTRTCSRHNHRPYTTRLSRSIFRFSTPTNLHRRCRCLLLSTQVLGVEASPGLLARYASDVAGLSPSIVYTLLSSLGASIAGFGALHFQARESPPGLERPRAGQRHGARRARRRVLWCPCIHYRPSVRASLAEFLRFITVSNARSLIPIMERNIALNNLSSVTAAELDWYVVSTPLPGSVPSAPPRSKPIPEHLPRLDIVLAADCVYFEPAFPLLVATLAALVPRPRESLASPEVLFCYKKRRKADRRFFALLKKQFTWSVVCYFPSLRALGYFLLLNMKSKKFIEQINRLLTSLCRSMMTPRENRTIARRSHFFVCLVACNRAFVAFVVPVDVGMHFVCPVVHRLSYTLPSLLHVALCTCLSSNC